MISERDFEALSAYVDGQLSQRDREALESRLAGERELRHALKDLRQDRLLLQKLPARRAPRNFTLTRAQAAAIRPPRRSGFFAFSTFNVMRLATGLASLLFVTLLGLDLARSGGMAREVAPQPDTGSAFVASTAPIEAAAPQVEGAETVDPANLVGLAPVAEGTPVPEQLTEDLMTLSQSGAPTDLEGAQGGGVAGTGPETPDITAAKTSAETATEPVDGSTARMTVDGQTPEATPEAAFGAYAAPASDLPPQVTGTEIQLSTPEQPRPMFELWTIGAGVLALALASFTVAIWLFRRSS